MNEFKLTAQGPTVETEESVKRTETAGKQNISVQNNTILQQNDNQKVQKEQTKIAW